MTRTSLRRPKVDELQMLSDLCLRSKAYWGYDDAFLAACREELSVREADIPETIIAEHDGRVAGVAQVSVAGQHAELEKLFVSPDAMGIGVGRKLFQWCRDRAASQGASTLNIEADPDARPFYERMGGRVVGTAASASIPGRRLPVLHLSLDPVSFI